MLRHLIMWGSFLCPFATIAFAKEDIIVVKGKGEREVSLLVKIQKPLNLKT